jgi:hypothetical protein
MVRVLPTLSVNIIVRLFNDLFLLDEISRSTCMLFILCCKSVAGRKNFI